MEHKPLQTKVLQLEKYLNEIRENFHGLFLMYFDPPQIPDLFFVCDFIFPFFVFGERSSR